jgi:hypothetical protein
MVVLVLVSVCKASPVKWSENGHFYLAVPAPDGITWTDANQVANLLGGHLVTIQDANENDFVFSLVDDEIFWFYEPPFWVQGPWLGGYQPQDSAEPDEGWRWVTEEPFDYTNWFQGSPDEFSWGDCTEQDNLNFLGRFSRQPTWNDIWDNCPPVLPHGYIIEFSEPNAGPVKWAIADGGNGHFYLPVAVPEGITWSQANGAASSLGGHLVTMTSLEENDFVLAQVRDDIYWTKYGRGASVGPWIGGYQLPGSVEPANGWLWVTGAPFTYTNWAEGEPSNSQREGPNENAMHFLTLAPGQFAITVWNDLPEDYAEVHGYVIEFPRCAEDICGDLNEDCVVDLKDFAIMASHWLECNLLLE